MPRVRCQRLPTLDAACCPSSSPRSSAAATSGCSSSTGASVAQINALEPQFAALSTTPRCAPRPTSSDSASPSGETLDELLPEAFAVVREAGKRALKMRHFDVQLIGGMVLHNGKIAEMRTGEGKTLVATLPVYLNALAGKGVHVVTVNDYLASATPSGWAGSTASSA